MSDLKEKVAELNDFEENMSFENYKEGVIAYSLKKVLNILIKIEINKKHFLN